MCDAISREAEIQWVKTECNPYGKPTLDFESGKKVMEHLGQMPSIGSKTKCIAQIRINHDDMENLINEKVTEIVNKMSESKIGTWINRDYCQVNEDGYEVATCSECGAEITIEYPYDNYCPNCGARMVNI